jgi:hypothetical protein
MCSTHIRFRNAVFLVVHKRSNFLKLKYILRDTLLIRFRNYGVNVYLTKAVNQGFS